MKIQSHADSFESQLETKLKLDDVSNALGMLTDFERDVILLRFIADLSNAEVAKILGKSLNNIKTRQFKALGKLRSILEPKYSE